MHKTITLIVAILLLATSCHAASSSNYTWTELEDGLSYAKITFTHGEVNAQRRTTIHAFKIDPKKFRLDVITAPKDKSMGEHVDDMARREGAFIAVNGGFFTPEHKSIGLLVMSGKEINPLHNTSWWSVFAIHHGTPLILRPWQAQGKHRFQMAVQAGPRLVVNSSIPKLKADTKAARTAIGITRTGDVIIIATEGAGLTMQKLAEKMKAKRNAGGLGCPNAMALDGGSSTQLYANAGKVKLNLDGISRVPNGVGVFRK